VTKPLNFAKDKVTFVTDFEHWSELKKMFFCCLRLPPGAFHQTADELLLATDEIDHSTLIVANECDAANITHGNGIRDFELAIA